MLRLTVPWFHGSRWPARPWPFVDTAPGFRTYLRDESGLRAATIRAYAHHLRHNEPEMDEVATS